jgi:spectinomycin phosphotransferase
MFQQRSPALVLCHTDYHRANILLDAQGQIHVVDWDTPLLAPKERDLMFIAGDGAAQERYIQLFFEGYGPAEIDAVGIAYYRYEWVVQEFNDYAARIILSPDLSDNSRQDALRQFQQLFDPGDVVDLAYQSDDACFTGSGGTAT